jgi:transcriptional regulator with XRE-family HTH domain
MRGLLRGHRLTLGLNQIAHRDAKDHGNLVKDLCGNINAAPLIQRNTPDGLANASRELSLREVTRFPKFPDGNLHDALQNLITLKYIVTNLIFNKNCGLSVTCQSRYFNVIKVRREQGASRAASRQGEHGCMDDLKAFGARIRRRRKQQGLKQTVIAEALNYAHPSSITHIEKGRADLPISKLYSLARVLDVPIWHFFLDEAVERAGVDLQAVPPQTRRLLTAWNGLSEAEQETLIGFAEVLQQGGEDIHQQLRDLLQTFQENLRARRITRGPGGASEANGASAS